MAHRGKMLPFAERVAIRRAIDEGKSERQVAKDMKLARGTVRRWLGKK